MIGGPAMVGRPGFRVWFLSHKGLPMTSAKVLANLKKLAGKDSDEPKKKPVVAAAPAAAPSKGSKWTQIVDDDDSEDADVEESDDDDDEDEEPAKTAVRPLADKSDDDAEFVEKCVELLCEVVDFIAANRDKLHRLIQN